MITKIIDVLAFFYIYKNNDGYRRIIRRHRVQTEKNLTVGLTDKTTRISCISKFKN